jgi:hypothetical protein
MTQQELPTVSTKATHSIITEGPYSAGHRQFEGRSRLCGRRQSNVAPVVQYQTAYSQMISFVVVRTMYMKTHYVNFKCILQQTTDKLHGTYSPWAASSSSGSQISCLSWNLISNNPICTNPPLDSIQPNLHLQQLFIQVNTFIFLLARGCRNQWPRRLKTWVCGRSVVWIVGSNPTGNMDVCLVWVLYVVRWSLRQADHSSRVVLPSVVCPSVIVKPRQWGGSGPLGSVMPWQKNKVFAYVFEEFLPKLRTNVHMYIFPCAPHPTPILSLLLLYL